MSSASQPQGPVSVKDRWAEGVANEVEFWGQVISGEGPNGHFNSDLQRRLDPETKVLSYLRAHLPTDRTPRILDVASGPVTNVGWRNGEQRLDVTAVDALADEFNALLDAHGLTPPVRTRRGDGETLDQLFPADHFDVVHIRNGLDHCYDPLRVLDNALKVTRPGGAVFVVGYLNEAEFESYIGLHQWNVDVRDGDIVIWRPDETHSLKAIFKGRAKVKATTHPDRYMVGILRKL